MPDDSAGIDTQNRCSYRLAVFRFWSSWSNSRSVLLQATRPDRFWNRRRQQALLSSVQTLSVYVHREANAQLMHSGKKDKNTGGRLGGKKESPLHCQDLSFPSSSESSSISSSNSGKSSHSNSSSASSSNRGSASSSNSSFTGSSNSKASSICNSNSGAPPTAATAIKVVVAGPAEALSAAVSALTAAPPAVEECWKSSLLLFRGWMYNLPTELVMAELLTTEMKNKKKNLWFQKFGPIRSCVAISYVDGSSTFLEVGLLEVQNDEMFSC